MNNKEISIINVQLIDYLNSAVDVQSSRVDLKKQSKKMVKRFKKAGYKIKYGSNNDTLINSIAGAAIVTGGSLASAGPLVFASSTSAGAVAAALIATPVLAVGGVMRLVNNSKINKQIQICQTPLPFVIVSGESQMVDLFYPATPSPHFLNVIYSTSDGEHQLQLDISDVTVGLHILKFP